MFLCLSLLLLIRFFVAMSHLWFQRYLLSSPSTVADLIGILRAVDVREVADLLDPSKEEILRLNSTPEQFQRAQRARAAVLFEQLRSMTFNALVLLLWTERVRLRLQMPGMPKDEMGLRHADEIAEEGPVVRLFGFAGLLRLTLWILLGAMSMRPLSRLGRLQRLGRIDGLDTYIRVAGAAALLSTRYDSGGTSLLAKILVGRSENA